MSRLGDLMDAWVTELRSSVPGLADAIVHKGAPWNPEEMQLDRGERHMAIWPSADVETREILTNDAHELGQSMIVLVWEDAGPATDRRTADEVADYAFLDLWEQVRDRFYVQANQWIGASERTWYVRSDFPDEIFTTRWFLVRFGVRVYRGFTP